MKKQVATFLLFFVCLQAHLMSYYMEVNASYDYFRGMPDGSWNGNSGALLGANGGMTFYNLVNLQAGGSYGVYNWDGRNNVVFANPKRLEQIGFVTAGASTSTCGFNLGLVYDCMFSRYFGIYDLNPTIDQLRFQVGYVSCAEEFGIWGTSSLKTAREDAVGIPTDFRTVSYMNIFWKHLYENGSLTNVWVGVPYRNSLMYPHKKQGTCTLGFSFRVPLSCQFSIDGNGSYLFAHPSRRTQNRNYGANICVGITYNFSDTGACEIPYMPIANHSNFYVDTNQNQ